MAATWDRYLEAAVTDPDAQPVDTLIDAHTHIGQVRVDELPVTPERMVEYMDAYGVDRAVLLPLESPMSSAYYVTTRDVLAATARFPDRFIPFCSVDPRMHYRWGKERYVDVIREYVDQGARGFGELKCDLPVDHEHLQLLYEICDEEGLPILLHVDGYMCTDEPGLPAVERMLQQYSGVDFIMHAPGWWAHISAGVTEEEMDGYPDGPVESGGRCDDLLSAYDNLYADISMGSGFNALTRDEEYGQTFLERHHERLLFGTDYLFPGQTLPQFGFFTQFDLPRGAWEDVCYRNIERLLLRE